MQLRVRTRELKINLLLEEVKLPEMPDKVIELSGGQLPDRFSGKSLVKVGPTSIVVKWDFSSTLVTELQADLLADLELDSVTLWGQNTFVASNQGVESIVNGLIGISVER